MASSLINRRFLNKSVLTLFFVLFTCYISNAQWSSAGTTNKGVITPTAVSQTTANFNPNGLVPYWSFAGTAGVCYYISLCSSANTEDAVLNVYSGASPGGALVAANDEGACPSKSSLTFVCPSTATYYISANTYPLGAFTTNSNLNLTYYICGAVTPVATPVTENWSVSTVTTACTGWMAHGAGSEGDWIINTGGNFAYGPNLAGGSGNELVFAGDQYEIYGTGVTKLATITSYPINTNGTNSMVFSWKQTLEINGDILVSGSNAVTVKLQSSSDLINWTDQWTGGPYPVTGSATQPLLNATTAVTINTNTNVTTWLRFYLSAVPGKLAYWAIDDANSGIIILPIELTRFSGQQIDNKTKLEWITASESNNNYFTIERSLDGTNFTPIGTIKGADNSNTTLNYSAFDEEPAVGINYYRLKQTDYNGDYKYSAVVTVNYLSKGASFGNLHPNPANENVNFDLYSPVSTKGNLQVIDITGRVISDEPQNISVGNQTVSTGLNSLSNGIYYLKISIDEIGYSHISKIIKN